MAISTSSQESQSQYGAPPLMAEMNMTPMVDVMLVLLIVLMIAIPSVQVSASLQLPSDSTHVLPQDPPKPLQIRLLADGQWMLNERSVSAQTLTNELTRLSGAQPKPEEASVQIYADKTVPYEQVAQAIAATRAANISKVGFVMEPTP